MIKGFGKVSMISFYLFSSFIVALTACVVIGLALFVSSLSALREANLNQIQEKVEMIASNTGDQLQIMEDVSYIVTTKIMYNKSLLRRNIYNDLVLLNDLSQYQSRSQVFEYYYLMYNGESKVYQVQPHNKGETSMFHTYISRMKIEDEVEGLYESINAVTEFTVIPVTIGGTETLMFAYPIYTMGKNHEAGRAILVFIASGDLLRAHFDTLVGDLRGNISLIIDDNVMVIQQEEISPTSVVTASSADGFVTVVYELPSWVLAEGTNGLRTVNMLYISIAILFIVAVAAYFGYINYKPILRLSQKYLANRQGVIGKNEIVKIETFFDDILSTKGSLEGDLLSQYEFTRQQILLLLLSGNNRYHALVKKSFMGITLPGPRYLVVAITADRTLNDGDTMTLAEQTALLSERACYSTFRTRRQKTYMR